MRGIDPKADTLVQGDEARIRQSFLNMKLIAESEGATLRDCVRIVVYATGMYRFRPIADQVQEEPWVKGPYAPRTLVEVHRSTRTTFSKSSGHVLRAHAEKTGLTVSPRSRGAVIDDARRLDPANSPFCPPREGTKEGHHPRAKPAG